MCAKIPASCESRLGFGVLAGWPRVASCSAVGSTRFALRAARAFAARGAGSAVARVAVGCGAGAAPVAHGQCQIATLRACES